MRNDPKVVSHRWDVATPEVLHLPVALQPNELSRGPLVSATFLPRCHPLIAGENVTVLRMAEFVRERPALEALCHALPEADAPEIVTVLAVTSQQWRPLDDNASALSKIK